MCPFRIVIHATAQELLNSVNPYLQLREVEATMILPFAIERQTIIGSGSGQSLWLTFWTAGGPSTPPTLDFALSCINGSPLFLFSNIDASNMTPNYLSTRASFMASRLLDLIPFNRVASVFGPTPLADAITHYWSQVTGIPRMTTPYYHANLARCTPATYRHSLLALPNGHQVVLADQSHLNQAAQLVQSFSSTTDFPLDDHKAHTVAQSLISHHKLWVHQVIYLDAIAGQQMREVTSIVALGRETWNVSAITHVFTATSRRSRGHAGHLLRKVCRHLFENGRTPILFSEFHNSQATRLFRSVGFSDITDTPAPSPLTWTEYGLAGISRIRW